MRAIPNMTIVAPCDAEEMKRLVPQTLDWPGPMYIRFGKGGDPIVSEPERPFGIGKGILLREGNDALIVTTGITLKEALEAHEALKAEGIGAAVLHLHTVKPLDAEGLLAAASSARAVVTMEEHTIIGGLGSAVAEVLAEANLSPAKKFKRLAVPDEFPSLYGSQAGEMTHYGITAQAAAAAVRALLA